MITLKNMEYETREGESVKQSVINQLNVLLSTPVGTVPLDRDFGINYSFIDMPTSIAENMLTNELSEKVEKYIPDIVIERIAIIKHEISNPEKLHFKVVISDAK